MSKLSFRARALDASKPMPIYLAEELPDLPDYSAINRAVPQMPSGMEKEEESEHHLQRAISGTGLIIPTPEVCEVTDLAFYERCYPPDYKMPKQHIHMQPLWEEQEAPEYDIDSEDERWLKQQRHPELTEWKFEQMMDKLEKSSGQTVVTLNEAKLLLERHDDLVTAVYDYWLNKRLTTQHPLILSVKTESRPGQSSNNPYLAFRRRTEKMQTRKNRKNDESSYEKMLKLRRDLARALTLLELVARRETAKRELVRLTAQLAERRYAAGDFASQLLPDPPPRPQYTSVSLTTSSFRTYSMPHFPPRAPPTPVDQPRQREKRPYKRRKRHPAVSSAPGLREAGAGAASSSEEEGRAGAGPVAAGAEPVDDGPFAFRRKPGCYYEMPTSTLCGDPVGPDSAASGAAYDHELDERNRFTLTSVNHPYPHCVGFARRRVGRGGRVILDRIRTPLDELWPRLPFRYPDSSEARQHAMEEVDLETKAHRTPKEITRDYHTGGKYPWRHTFRQHLAKNPHLWTEDVKPELKMDVDVKPECDVNSVKSDSVRTIDCNVRDSLQRVMRKRSWSGCSDSSSYDSDESLHPVEKEFENFINEVNKKWLHFRPKTPPPSPPLPEAPPDDQQLIALDTPIAVELTTESPTKGLDTFTTSEFTLSDLYGDVTIEDRDTSGSGLDISGDDLLGENFTGLTEAQVESILSETDLKALAEVDLTKDDKKLSEDILELVNDDKDPFLYQGQSSEGRAGSGRAARARGCSGVRVLPPPRSPLYVRPPPAPAPAPAPPAPAASEVVPQVKVEKKKKEEVLSSEEVHQLPHGVQLKTVQTKHSPLKKHIITSTAHRRPSDVTVVTSQEPPQQPQPQQQQQQQPQIVTVAVSDSLKVRLQNHLLSSQAGVLVQNGPFSPVAVAVPVQQARETATVVPGVSVSASTSSPRRVSAPLVHLAPAALAHKPLQLQAAAGQPAPLVVGSPHALHHVPGNKLKVLHAHPLTHTQRTQLLAGNRALGQLPAVVSLASLASLAPLHQDTKPAGAAGAALIKAAPGSVAQLFEIKTAHLAKGPQLVNVVRPPQPGKTTVTRLDIHDPKRRQVVALDGAALKGNMAGGARPHRVSVSLDGRQIVRAALPATRHQHPRHQIQLKNRTLQVATPVARSATEPSSSMAAAPAPSKTASIPSAVVANLLQKNIQLPLGAQKIAISGAGQPLSANVQAIAFTAAQLKARQARLVQPRAVTRPEIVEAASVPAASTSNMAEAPLEVAEGEEPAANGAVRRRPADTLPMEVT